MTTATTSATALGPWKNRSHLRTELDAPANLVAAHLDPTYWVQRYQYDERPEVDHIMVGRHDHQPIRSWPDLQAIKDRLAPDGQFRYAIEIYPPRRFLVDQHHIYHLWVMPPGWTPGVGLHPDQDGFVGHAVAALDQATSSAPPVAPEAPAAATAAPVATATIAPSRRRRTGATLNLARRQVSVLDALLERVTAVTEKGERLRRMLVLDDDQAEDLTDIKGKLERLPHAQPEPEPAAF